MKLLHGRLLGGGAVLVQLHVHVHVHATCQPIQFGEGFGLCGTQKSGRTSGMFADDRGKGIQGIGKCGG